MIKEVYKAKNFHELLNILKIIKEKGNTIRCETNTAVKATLDEIIN
jgi:hypothetical protein